MEANSAIRELPPPCGSSIKPPKWLLFSLITLLGLRVLLSFNQQQQPMSVRFYPADQAKVLSKANDKPILYIISADWSAPCKTMENRALSNNRDVTSFINDNFFPVLVMDKESNNDHKTTELLKKYDISYLPDFIATLDDGTLIRKESSYSGAQHLKSTLKTFLLDVPYAKGKRAMSVGDFSNAHRLFSSYLTATRYSSLRSGWASVYDILCLRTLGDKSGAEVALREALKHQRIVEYKTKAIIDYLAGKYTGQALLKRAYRPEDSSPYHFVVGIDRYAAGDFAQAKLDLGWVVENAAHNGVEKKLSKVILNSIKERQHDQPQN